MALFVSSIGLKQASGGKIPLFYSSFFLYSEPNFSALMLLWQAQSYFSSANLAFPVTFTTQTFDAISLHVYFPSLEQSRHRNSVLKISFFFLFSNLIFKIRHSASWTPLHNVWQCKTASTFKFVCVPTEWSQLYTFEQILFVQTQRQWYIE